MKAHHGRRHIMIPTSLSTATVYRKADSDVGGGTGPNTGGPLSESRSASEYLVGHGPAPSAGVWRRAKLQVFKSGAPLSAALGLLMKSNSFTSCLRSGTVNGEIRAFGGRLRRESAGYVGRAVADVNLAALARSRRAYDERPPTPRRGNCRTLSSLAIRH